MRNLQSPPTLRKDELNLTLPIGRLRTRANISCSNKLVAVAGVVLSSSSSTSIIFSYVFSSIFSSQIPTPRLSNFPDGRSGIASTAIQVDGIMNGGSRVDKRFFALAISNLALIPCGPSCTTWQMSEVIVESEISLRDKIATSLFLK